MNVTGFMQLYVFMLAAFVGYQIITRVPPLLHTPLMSATNAISAISLVGSLVAAGSDRGTVSTVLGFVAVTAATINMVGGFVSSQFPPASAARSTITEPGCIDSTIAFVMSTGAARPGMSAVVMTRS